MAHCQGCVLVAVVCLSVASSRSADYVVDFEGEGETKTAYASGTVILSGLEWNLTEALIGTLTNDWKVGARSARLRGHATSAMTMVEDRTHGMGTLSFCYRRYATDAQIDWRVVCSCDGGSNWVQIGSNIRADEVVRQFSETADLPGSVRMRIEAVNGDSTDRRMNIDNITISAYTGAPPPLVVICDPAQDPVPAANAVDWYVVSGSAERVTGQICWSNVLNGLCGTVPAQAVWHTPPVPLSCGENEITICGTNTCGLPALDRVSIVRREPGLSPGDVALIGWSDNSSPDAFAFVALADLPAGTVLYFTDNGWSNNTFRSASAEDGDGYEDLLKCRLTTSIPAGVIVRAGETSAGVEWTDSGPVPGASAGSFSDLALSADGDQITVFQGPEENPLFTPGPHLFLLDDTGDFEASVDSHTGNVPPGLFAGVTALSFDRDGGSEHSMAFTNRSGGVKPKSQWLSAIADPVNWSFGASGLLPSGSLQVLPAPLFSVRTHPDNGGMVIGAGYYDPGEIVRATVIPAKGWRFSGWADCSAGMERNVIMPAGGLTLEARFSWKGLVWMLR